MKKLSLFILSVGFSLATMAQVQLGIKAGLNIADIEDEAVPGTDSRLGFHGGLLAHIHLRPRLALQPEIVFSTQGAEYPNGEVETSYLNIPLLLQYLNRGLRLQTGPQLGILLDAEQERNDGRVINLEPSMNDADFAWVFGLGYLTRSGLGIDARFNLGLSDVFEGARPDSKNRVWQIGLFYQFRP